MANNHSETVAAGAELLPHRRTNSQEALPSTLSGSNRVRRGIPIYGPSGRASEAFLLVFL
eukprot:4954690-Amphidinium_carterae.1